MIESRYRQEVNADQWGVSYGYVDTDGVTHTASDATRFAIREALGATNDPNSAPTATGAIVVNSGDRWQTDNEAFLELEDGSQHTLTPGWTLTDNLPFGYHHIRFADQATSRAFIHAPVACALPDDFRGWGWAVQLYGMRSRESWGIGDFSDLKTLNEWSAKRGARYTLINPLHAATPTPGQQPSPYFPTSRVWRNPLYIRIEHVAGWALVAGELAEVATAARAMLDDRRINRDQVRLAKMFALERIWQLWSENQNAIPTESRQSFSNWRAHHGEALTYFGLYCALVEQHGGDIREWPTTLSNAQASAVPEALGKHRDRIAFHAWLQWLTESQLAQANEALPVMTDLAIGVDRAGADAWVWPAAFSRTMTVGAPPDTFNTQGQSWGLAPFDPWRLRDLNYEPFIRTVRSAFQSAGAVRMDHVMGLFRLWWIPQGHSPKDGCYVYLPFRDLTGILALESHRANLGVVGEDLGTIEPYVSTELEQRKILSYKLVQFESGPTSELPENSMVAVTTHDLSTLAGALTGTDLLEAALVGSKPYARGAFEVRAALLQRAAIPAENDDPAEDLLAVLEHNDRSLVNELLGLTVDEPPTLANLALSRSTTVEAIEADIRRISALLSDHQHPGVTSLVKALTADLGTAPSRLVCTMLEDALGVEERPNLPGTIDERPNWRIALPSPLEVILAHPEVDAMAATLSTTKGRS